MNTERDDKDGLTCFSDLIIHKFMIFDTFRTPLAWVDDILLTMALGFEVFGIFITGSTFCNVYNNQTEADKHKKLVRLPRTLSQTLTVIFGS